MTSEQNTQTDSKPSEDSRPGVNRRQFLGGGAIAAAALAAPTTVWGGEEAQANSEPTQQNPGSIKRIPNHFVIFEEPHVVCSSYGEARLQLNVVMNPVLLRRKKLVEVEEVKTRCYNGQIPGSTIFVNPGDKIRISLKNRLPENPAPNPEDDNCPNNFNTTNLHFHGLHVSPASICENSVNQKKILSSDDLLLEVLPQFSDEPDKPNVRVFCHEYLVWLPKFHAPGTHWYHAHRHGSTAIHVSNGMAGAIIVKEPPEDRIVDETRDKVWIMQEVLGENDSDIYCKPTTHESEFLINGQYQPTITLQAGEVQRWRFINATSSTQGLMNLKLVKVVEKDVDPYYDAPLRGKVVDMHLMAVDGISFYGKAPQPTPGWDMAAGNRADFLVQLEPGWYKVVKDLFSQRGGSTVSCPQVLAFVRVPDNQTDLYCPKNYDEELPTVIPGKPPRYLLPIHPSEIGNADKPRQICFLVYDYFPDTDNFEKRRSFLINKRIYDHKRLDIQVNLGDVEAWELKNEGIWKKKGDEEEIEKDPSQGQAHPFHIHVNPFQVVGEKIDPHGPDDSTNWRWRDVVAVPPSPAPNRLPIPITIWQRFLDYPGEYVLHCHILTHEDQGMMQNVRVNYNGEPLSECGSDGLDLSSWENWAMLPACPSDAKGMEDCEWPTDVKPCNSIFGDVEDSSCEVDIEIPEPSLCNHCQ
ncbi:MAG: multicopper oxidase family protein [Cyanobacteriota bacterium]|nr:multicopper oxidase family protein [Cyanobacteriota bacterium]